MRQEAFFSLLGQAKALYQRARELCQMEHFLTRESHEFCQMGHILIHESRELCQMEHFF